ncbi:hypothetical protein TNCV_940401 [Trichonephila clavipes]|nr:hypothetical protein TNCV_940401 [Trichonephila clavipes]
MLIPNNQWISSMGILWLSKTKAFTSVIISCVMTRRVCPGRASSSKEHFAPFHNTLTTQTVLTVHTLHPSMQGCGSPVVKVSDHGRRQ